MLILLRDTQKTPRMFSLFGAIPLTEIQDWLRRTGVVLPSDVIEVWQETGGGDVFESETILRVTVASIPNRCFVEDDIGRINGACAEEGKFGGLHVFHRRLFRSAVRFSEQRFVTPTEDGLYGQRFLCFTRRVVVPRAQGRVR